MILSPYLVATSSSSQTRSQSSFELQTVQHEIFFFFYYVFIIDSWFYNLGKYHGSSKV